MKKIFRYLLFFILFIVILVGGLAAAIAIRGIPDYEAKRVDIKVDPTSERVENGRKLFRMLCNDCHFDQNTGKLTGREMSEIDMFGKLYSKNITKDPDFGIGKWTDGEIEYLLRTGVKPDGRFLPVMAKLHKMSDEDMSSIIAYLRSDDPLVQPDNTRQPESNYSFLAKFLTNIKAFEPMPYPETGHVAEPDTTDLVKWGEYVALNRVECYTCHSSDFTKLDFINPPKSGGYFAGGNKFELPDGRVVYSRNLTMDEETGIGSWTEETFVRAVRTGVLPHGPAVREPMKPYADLSEGEVKAIYAYLKTIPKIHNKVDRGL